MRSYNRGKPNEFRACGAACASGFRTDRRYGLIYGPFMRDDKSMIQCAEIASVEWNSCVYCRTVATRRSRSAVASGRAAIQAHLERGAALLRRSRHGWIEATEQQRQYVAQHGSTIDENEAHNYGVRKQ